MFKRSVLETVEVATAGCELEAMFHVEHSATSEWEDILFDCRRGRAFENSPIRQLNVDGTIDVCLESAYSILFSWMVHPSVLRRKFYTECFTWNSDRLRSGSTDKFHGSLRPREPPTVSIDPPIPINTYCSDQPGTLHQRSTWNISAKTWLDLRSRRKKKESRWCDPDSKGPHEF